MSNGVSFGDNTRKVLLASVILSFLASTGMNYGTSTNTIVLTLEDLYPPQNLNKCVLLYLIYRTFPDASICFKPILLYRNPKCFLVSWAKSLIFFTPLGVLNKYANMVAPHFLGQRLDNMLRGNSPMQALHTEAASHTKIFSRPYDIFSRDHIALFFPSPEQEGFPLSPIVTSINKEVKNENKCEDFG